MEEEQRTKIADLELDEDSKKMLTIMAGKPKDMHEITALCNMSYSWVQQKLNVYQYKGYVRKYRTAHGKTIWFLNEGELEL